jgi:hypothetical protein
MSNIDEKAKNNFTIDIRIFENYEKVKHEIIRVIDFLRHAETNLGMCRIFDNQNHEFWYRVIEIQKYYVFFYEVRNSRRIIGKNKIKEILDILL